MYKWICVIFLVGLSSCDGDKSSSDALPIASVNELRIAGVTPGVTPFIAIVELTSSTLQSAISVSYTIEPKPGSASAAVSVSYSRQALDRRSEASKTASVVKLPVFGLYSGYANNVTIHVTFSDASVETIQTILPTAAYTDPTGVYDKVSFVQRRAVGSALGFSYFALKSGLGTPVVIDTDGEIRWVGVGVAASTSSILVDNGFTIGGTNGVNLIRLDLDGSTTVLPFSSGTFLGFNHNFDYGKNGILTLPSEPLYPESVVAELNTVSGFGKFWDLGQIISDYMTSQGDDPSVFVISGADWFHSNSSTYDPSDDSIIVSSRENFLIKLDYQSGNIVWIFGDPTKYWYTFPSLRAKALTLTGGGLYPIGQHATSITSDGLLMVINDGDGSLEQPAGTPPGVTRTYTAVSAYSIDAASRTATEVRQFSFGQTVYSPVCGSAYEAHNQSLLIDYASTENIKAAKIVGLDNGQNVIFDFRYASVNCASGWNAVPIYFEQLQII